MKFYQVTIFSILLIFCVRVSAQINPIVRHIYTADPSARVWLDGRLYVYPSQDIDPPSGCDRMDKYHVFSTDDMINWTDHGQIVEASQVPWDVPITDASTNATFMWAPDCVYKGGKYYFYFPHPKGPTWNNTWQIGIAVSDFPAKDFTVLPEPLKGTTVSWIEGGKTVTAPGLIDPNIFMDDDGQIYFYFGGGNRCFGGKLKDNMIEVDGTLEQMTGLTDFHEGAWVFKREGKYYLMYADNYAGANRQRYAISDSPLGPWTYKGIFLNPTTSDTSHGSVVEYKGQWYSFYHTADLSGTGLLRSICVDSLFFNLDGTIRTVRQTKDQGSSYLGVLKTVPGTIEAEDYNEGGKGIAYWDTTTGNSGLEYRRNEDVDIKKYRQLNMYYVADMAQGEYLNYTFDVLEDDVFTIDFHIASALTGQTPRFYLEFDYQKTNNPRRYDVPYTALSALGVITTVEIELSKGIHTMRFIPQGNMNFDKFVFNGMKSSVRNLELLSVEILPNPAKDGIFKIKNIESKTFANVLDINGRTILSTSLSPQNNTLDLSKFPKGIYLLNLKVGIKTSTSKLIFE